MKNSISVPERTFDFSDFDDGLFKHEDSDKDFTKGHLISIDQAAITFITNLVNKPCFWNPNNYRYMWNMEERRMILLLRPKIVHLTVWKRKSQKIPLNIKNVKQNSVISIVWVNTKKCSHIGAKLDYDKCGMVPEDKIRLDKHIKTHHQDTNRWPKSDFVIFGFEQWHLEEPNIMVIAMVMNMAIFVRASKNKSFLSSWKKIIKFSMDTCNFLA